ncbi:rRNA maturation RNase YbeY [Helicobacter cholecystus]|uniref:Endoribonuclease YbeY n=1 Tax=Helicobacter cholecystus TaxID=45498 RepID=A0A3D8IXF5_9HELI|nr:rRNA maturation RNase YbeY [Helicobacter cholecystus]RDU69942.1 rRNA maturation RNase YbeY [Helicobacter cholecystus]VEJ24893.1 metalloprotease [Helicobacter cholecystus]
MIYFENQSVLELKDLEFEKILEYLHITREVEVYILEDEEMAELNFTHRGKKGITDVLSFPCEEVVEGLPLGSIVMSSTLIEQKAREYAHSLESEATLLFIHALLHLLGYDHEVDNGEHREKEKEIIEHFNLPQSLVIRSNV